MSFQRIDYKQVFRKAKNRKFDALFEVKPDLNPAVHCAFHPSEGCTQCAYRKRCGITDLENGVNLYG